MLQPYDTECHSESQRETECEAPFPFITRTLEQHGEGQAPKVGVFPERTHAELVSEATWRDLSRGFARRENERRGRPASLYDVPEALITRPAFQREDEYGYACRKGSQKKSVGKDCESHLSNVN